MTGDRIDECKGEIDRIFLEMVSLGPQIDAAEAKQLATTVLQLIKDGNDHAKNAYRFALEMAQLVTPDDGRAPLIKKIVEVVRKILLEVSNKSLKLAEKACEVVSEISAEALASYNELKIKRDQLFKQYKELSSIYDLISSSDTMDVLELLESEIHARKSTIIELGKKCDETVWAADNVSMDPVSVRQFLSKVVQLNEEVHPIAEKSREYGLWMQSLVSPNDPRAAVITKIVEATEKGLQLSTEALELARRAVCVLSGTNSMTAIRNNPMMMVEMSVKSCEFVDRRNRLDEEYEQLSLAFKTGTPLEEARGGEEEIPLD